MKKITQKQYIRALEIVKLYEIQKSEIKEFEKQNPKCQSNTTVILDDVYFYISLDDEEFRCIHQHEFYDVLRIILTTKQYENYVSDYTYREFKVSNEKILEMKKYLKNNNWIKEKNINRDNID